MIKAPILLLEREITNINKQKFERLIADNKVTIRILPPLVGVIFI